MTNSVAAPPAALKLARILAPVDFSERCRHAVRNAESLARRFEAEVVLLHAVSPVGIPFGPAEALAYATSAELSQEQVSQITPALEEFLADELRGVPTTRVVLEGDPARSIFDYAAEHRCDLIVMPTHGYGALHRLVVGSVTAEVLRHAPCPVWTGCHFETLPEPVTCRSVACAIGMTGHDDLAESWAASFAAAYGAKFQVIDAPPAYADAAYIAARAEAAEADVLVIGRGARAYSIIRAAACPVVAV